MKNFCFLAFLLVITISCSTQKEDASLYDFIPEKASVVMSINNTEALKSSIKNSTFINTLTKSKIYNTLENKLSCLDYIKTDNPILISFVKNNKDSLDFVLSTRFTKNLIQIDSLPNHLSESLKINNLPGKKLTYKSNVVYTVVKDSIAIAASNLNVLKTTLNKKSTPEEINKIAKTFNNKKAVSVLIHNKEESIINSVFNSENLNFKNFTDYTAFDADISQDQLILNGITKASDSTKLINIFKNTIPQENQISHIAPNNCDGFLSVTFNAFSTFKNNLNLYNAKKDSTKINALFNNIVEFGVIYQGNNKSVVLNSLDIIATKEALISEENKVEDYRQIPIYSFSKPDLFENTLYPFVDFSTANLYCIIDQFLIFGNSKEDLENIIANYLNETTLKSRDYYTSTTQHLSTASSILHVLNPNSLKDVLDVNLDTYIDANLKQYKTSAIQFIYDTNFAHLNAVIKKSKAKAESGTVTELLNIKLDAPILNNPQFVTNHRTKQKEIVVQDIKNKLYLISNTGNILWKKQLKGPILGKIEQIDSYKNGRLQLVFATPNRVYLLDRTGKDVTGFPLKFNDKITQPLSVFDYDKNKKYRLFVTQGKNVLLYNGKGKTVKGFKFSKAKDIINTQPQHIRINNKDYIIIKTNKKLHILSRRGQTRIKTNTKFNYSNSPVYSFESGFATVSKDGSLVQINTKGKVSTSKLLGENSKLVTTTKTLVAQKENKLKIKTNTLDLDFGNYTKPKLFYINNKIYVSVTDLQSQKVLLFDSQAKPIANFPVYGKSTIDLDNIDKDNNLEFITKGDSDSILLYEIN